MKSLIIGATGATGKDLIQVMLNDPAYTEVRAFVRKNTGLASPKLKEIVTDFNDISAIADQVNGDVLFNCMGTTLKAAGSKDKQWHIDYEIPLKFAGIAKQNGVNKLVLLSAYGADSKSNIFYSKMKGQLEEACNALGFNKLIVFKPGLLLRKNTDRMGEKISEGILKFLNAIGILRKFKPMPTEVLAEKLAKAPIILSNGKHVIELDKIFKL